MCHLKSDRAHAWPGTDESHRVTGHARATILASRTNRHGTNRPDGSTGGTARMTRSMMGPCRAGLAWPDFQDYNCTIKQNNRPYENSDGA